MLCVIYVYRREMEYLKERFLNDCLGITENSITLQVEDKIIEYRTKEYFNFQVGDHVNLITWDERKREVHTNCTWIIKSEKDDTGSYRIMNLQNNRASCAEWLIELAD